VRAKIDSLPFLLKDSVNSFNTKLFKSLVAEESGNIFYSPFSLHMLLSQAYVGAPTRDRRYKTFSLRRQQ
jgi:hypothetical protein